jgi:WD40-like Beta Propeller Repeat
VTLHTKLIGTIVLGESRRATHRLGKASRMKGSTRLLALVAVAGTAAVLVAGVHAQTSWAPAQKIDEANGNNSEVNTSALDGCPIQSPDGLSLYMASNRPGGRGGLDIWVATRASTSAQWGAPTNLGEPVNSAADDFCPTPVGKKGLFFVSREALPGACGQGDIYFTHRNGAGAWAEPERLLCSPAGPNSELDEQGPSFVDTNGKTRAKKLLYFSRSSVTPGGAPGEIFMSSRQGGARFGTATAVTELNDATANDIQPNVRADGLEVVFSSNRTGSAGAQDIWAATRQRIADPWSAPINLGAAVNTGAAESRPSLSADGRQLLFGRAPGPEGMSDIYFTTR